MDPHKTNQPIQQGGETTPVESPLVKPERPKASKPKKPRKPKARKEQPSKTEVTAEVTVRPLALRLIIRKHKYPNA